MTDEIDDIIEATEELDDALHQSSEPLTRDDIEPIPDIDPSEYRKPWERIAEESDLHWVLFEHFRDSGLGRSVLSTRDWFNERGGIESKSSITDQFMYGLAKRNRWQDRCRAWDEEVERQYQLARSIATREMVDRHVGVIESAIEALTVPIEALLLRMESDPEFIEKVANSSPSKLIQLTNSVSRTLPALLSADRLAHDMPTDIVGGTVQHEHTVRIDRDHIGEVLAVFEEAHLMGLSAGSDDAGADLEDPGIIDAEVVEVHSVPAESDA